MDKDFFYFLKNAYSSGLCKEYRDEIRICHGVDLQLVRLAMRQQSYPWVATKIREGAITTDYILRRFGKYLNGYVLKDCDGVAGFSYSWFVCVKNENSIFAKTNVAHFTNVRDTNVVIPTSLCPVLYVSNKSDVSITGEGFNAIRVYLFDESVVNLDDFDENSSVLVYKYSKDARVEIGKYCLGKVKIFDKELKI